MDQFLPVKKAVRLQMWQQRINEFHSSGMKLKDWLKQNEITRDTYYYWLRKCREASLDNLPAEIKSQLPTTDDMVSFKKLEVKTPVTSMQAAVTIRLPQASIEVTNDATKATVEAVLLALKSVC